MKTLLDVEYVTGGGKSRSLDIHLPEGEGFPTFVYFHGGGLVDGSKSFTKNGFFVDEFLKRGVAVVSAEYRMYPEAKYPDFICDAAAAVAWVCENIRSFGGNGDVYVGGSSAGGYLSMMLCFDGQYLGAHGLAPTDIKGYIHDAGQPTTHFNVLRERGLDPKRLISDEAAPIWHVGLAKEYAPMIFIVADHDMVGRYEQTMLMHKTIAHFGYDMSRVLLEVVENSKHCEYVSHARPDGTSTLCELAMKIIKV